MLDLEHRKPNFRVSIMRPDYTATTYSEKTIVVFEPDEKNKTLLSYNYQQSIQSFDCQFSMTFAPEAVNQYGDTMIDVIKLLDVVKIEEHDEIKYLGVVNSTRYSARMGNGEPNRVISVSGYGIGGVLDQFPMSLNNIILSFAKISPDALETDLRAQVAGLSAEYGAGTPIYDALNTIKKTFKTTMERLGEYTPGTGIFNLIDQYLDFSSESKTLQSKYPLALSVFSYGDITLGQAWNQLISRPFYEFFPRWDSATRKWLIILRQTPFSPSNWNKLDRKVINPLHVESFDCGFSSNDVKTWFFAYMAGSGMSIEQSRSMYQETAIKRDSAKWALYGYRPLEATFMYVNQGKLATDNSLATLMGDFSSELQKWFGRADEMLTGGIEIMTMKNGPTVGNRVVFNDVEFYVESISGAWSYGGKMTTSLSVTRGGQYNKAFAAGTGPNGTDQETSSNWWFRKSTKLGNRLELKKENGK